MLQIPEALAAYRQFILYDSDKRPRSPHTGNYCDLTDPAQWSDAATACAAAAQRQCGVGFVFTAHDPFFFFDIDGALDRATGQWSPLAQQMCQVFQGCFIEVSRSGTGLHIIGTGTAPAHACKCVQHGLELYTQDRYVALTCHHAQGSPATVAQPQLEWLVASYFPPTAPTADIDWTDGPCDEWSGPTDDDELLQRMLASRGSAASMFGGRASVAELWNADVAALSRAYPATSEQALATYGYDHSSADAALCQHLAFWTGRDCERIDRLFRRSALYRDKWERTDYRQDTVLHGVRHCSAVYGSNRTVSAPAGDTPADAPRSVSTAAPGVLREGYQFMAITSQIEHFGRCVYVRDAHRIYTPDGSLLKPEQFKASYGGYVFALDVTNEKTTRNAWEVFTESQAYVFPRAHSTCFRPECEPGAMIEEESFTLVNTYTPIITERKQGDPTPFLQHLARLLPDPHDQQILLAYMAACCQYPGVKFQWMPLLQGMEGNGKTFFIRALSFAIGNRYTHLPNAQDISNKFNAWVCGKLFIGLEEVYTVDKQEKLEALKPLITNARVEIQGKGTDQITGDNRANFFGCSNHKDAIRKTWNDRRYSVFFTAQQDPGDLERWGMQGDYFPQLYAWANADGYAIVNDFLRSYPIPDALNPATHCHRAPETSTTREAVMASLGSVEQEILEAVEEGRPGFAGGWISSLALDRLLDERRLAARVPQSKRRGLLRTLGYDYHPALTDGRVNNVIPDPAGHGKPRLYIRSDCPAYGLMMANEVTRAYLEAQTGVTAAVFGGTPA